MDVLIFVNLIISLFLIKACDSLLHNRAKLWRTILACFICSLSSLTIFLPPMGLWLNLAVKLATAFIVTACAFGIKSLKSTLINWAAFFLISIAFAAVMIAIWMFISPAIMAVSNGSVYFDISPLALILGSAGCYGVITLLERLFAKRLPDKFCFDIVVTVDAATVKIPAILDTGNSLIDPLSGCPVVVAQYDALKPLFGHDNAVKQAWKSAGGYETSQLLPTDWQRRFRCISYSSVGGDGLLNGFKPDSAYVSMKGRIHKSECVIAVYNGMLSDEGYKAIAGKIIFDAAPSTA